MFQHPSGTVTFLFTDIEGSTKQWEAHPQAMRTAFARHETILRDAITANGGYTYKMIGDAFQAAFPTAPFALGAALDAQRALHSESWPAGTGELRVRMALHTGITQERGDDYVGPVLNRAARLLSAGHGGQVLVSEATYGLLRDSLPEGIALVDLGEHRLKDLFHPERIFQLAAPDLPSEFPPLNTLDARPHNLPVQPTLFIGREKETQAVVGLLRRDDVQLLTLTGPGGTGKTRLALQAAAELLDDYEDGIFFVDLAPISDPHLVLPAIAQTLGLRESGGKPIAESLKEYLRGQHLLLVLDNFEQVVEEAPVVSQLLAAAPELKVLVTSRVPLHIRSEKEYDVPPLQVPDSRRLPPLDRLTQYEAVHLFIERATSVRPGFQVTNDNAPAVAEICARLDGLPLAIELAAARIKFLTPQAILSRLSHRLQLLTSRMRDVDERQQTLRNTIEWSYDLLDVGEKRLFGRLAVFVGGATLEAIEAVCAPVEAVPPHEDGGLGADLLDTVGSLVDESLVRQEEGVGAEPRFVMLETVHEYACERLEASGELEELARRHAYFFLQLAEIADPELKRAQQTDWFQRLEEEHGNLRAALAWCQGPTGETEIGLRIAAALGWFWEVHGYLTEGSRWIASLLERTGPAQDATRSFAEARARVCGLAGNLADTQGDYAAALAMYEESLAIWRKQGNMGRVAGMLNNIGLVARNQSDLPRARVLLEESLAVKRQMGDKAAIASTLSNLGLVLTNVGDFPAAQAVLDESLVLFEDAGDTTGVATSLVNLGMLSLTRGDVPLARTQLERALRMFHEIGDVAGIAECLEGLAGIMVCSAPPGDQALDRLAEAVRLLGAAEVLREDAGVPLVAVERQRYDECVGAARSRMDEATFTRLWAEGRAMTMEQAVAYALVP